jgi:hypothetical protein
MSNLIIAILEKLMEFPILIFLDIRPRVSVPNVTEGSRSPFEFLSRNITQSGNSASNVLASDESILLSYSFYLPRIDKIFLQKVEHFN